jgi:protein-tyrosine phosphatase
VLDVLLVCTGNICRSPMAAGLLEERGRMLPAPLRVRSAGIAAARGQPPTSEAAAAIAELGADILSHRSAQLGPEAAQADLVLAMAAGHREEIRRRAPQASARTFTLKELAGLLRKLPLPDQPPSRKAALARIAEADRLRAAGPPEGETDVSDPLGLSLEAYRAAAWEIDAAVHEIMRGLFGEEG